MGLWTLKGLRFLCFLQFSTNFFPTTAFSKKYIFIFESESGAGTPFAGLPAKARRDYAM